MWRLRELSVARLTRFEGRGHKKFPKGPPFAHVFWRNFPRVPPLLTFFWKISKGSPLCWRSLQKFQKKLSKGGVLAFLPPPLNVLLPWIWPAAIIISPRITHNFLVHCVLLCSIVSPRPTRKKNKVIDSARQVTTFLRRKKLNFFLNQKMYKTTVEPLSIFCTGSRVPKLIWKFVDKTTANPSTAFSCPFVDRKKHWSKNKRRP